MTQILVVNDWFADRLIKRSIQSFTIENIEFEIMALDKVMIEVLTIDSSTCAACGYMTAAARDMLAIFGDKVEVIERKITEPENIVRVGKLGVMNLPTIVINGEVKFISIIPNREELKAAIEEKM